MATIDVPLVEAPVPIESVPRCRPLLAAYQRSLDSVPVMPYFLLERWRVGKRLFYPKVLFRPAVRFFVKQHIFRSLAALSQAYQRRAALLELTEPGASETEVLEEFDLELALVDRYRQSLGRKPPYRFLGVVFLLAAFVTTLVLLSTVPFPKSGEALPFLKTASAHVLPPDVPELWKATANASHSKAQVSTATQVTGTPAADETPNMDDFAVIAFALLALLTCLYIILRLLPIGAFTVKRLAFNYSPDALVRRPGGIKREHDTQATGIFELERQLFAALGATPPTDVPFDLLRSTVMVLPLLLAAAVLGARGVTLLAVREPSALGSYDEAKLAVMPYSLLLCTVPMFRVPDLLRVWKDRRTSRGSAVEVVSTAEGAVDPGLTMNTAGSALMMLIGAAWLVSAMFFTDVQASPARWGSESLAWLSLGLISIWVGRFAALPARFARLPPWAWKAPGYASVLAGLSGLVGLHNAVISLGAVLATVGALLIVESRDVRSERYQKLPASLAVPAIPLVMFGVLGLALWAWVEPVGPFPTSAEGMLLSLVPGQIRAGCTRRLGVPPYSKAISIRCPATEHVVVFLNQFPTARQSEGPLRRRYVHGRHLPAGPCDPATNAAFSGISDMVIPSGEVGQVICYLTESGRPWVEWTRTDRRVYAYASADTSQPDSQALRAELYDAWRIFNGDIG